jgi:hypothetical protein
MLVLCMFLWLDPFLKLAYWLYACISVVSFVMSFTYNLSKKKWERGRERSHFLFLSEINNLFICFKICISFSVKYLMVLYPCFIRLFFKVYIDSSRGFVLMFWRDFTYIRKISLFLCYEIQLIFYQTFIWSLLILVFVM